MVRVLPVETAGSNEPPIIKAGEIAPAVPTPTLRLITPMPAVYCDGLWPEAETEPTAIGILIARSNKLAATNSEYFRVIELL